VSGPKALAREVDVAQRTLAELTGDLPRFFRAPAGLRNVFLESVLQAFDLRLASWTRRGFDTRETDASLVAQRLLDDLAAGDILLVHDGNAAIGGGGLPVVLSVLPQVFSAAQRRQLQFVTLREALSIA
jgi:peptidoglycan-N-acetylglucosamine deacetylase